MSSSGLVKKMDAANKILSAADGGCLMKVSGISIPLQHPEHPSLGCGGLSLIGSTLPEKSRMKVVE